MLVLTRKLDESIRISDDITITILKVKGNTVRIGIEAPRSIRVVRSELDAKIVDGKADANAQPTVAAIVDSPAVSSPRLFVGTATVEDGKVTINESTGDAKGGDRSRIREAMLADQGAPLRAFLRNSSGLTAV